MQTIRMGKKRSGGMVEESLRSWLWFGRDIYMRKGGEGGAESRAAKESDCIM